LHTFNEVIKTFTKPCSSNYFVVAIIVIWNPRTHTNALTHTNTHVNMLAYTPIYTYTAITFILNVVLQEFFKLFV